MKVKLSALVNLEKKISLHSTTADMIDVPLILGADSLTSPFSSL